MADLGPLATTDVPELPDPVVTDMPGASSSIRRDNQVSGKRTTASWHRHSPTLGALLGLGVHRDDTTKYGIYGTVTYEDAPGDGLTLRLYSRETGELLSETVSDGAGEYDFNYWVAEGYKYYVIAFDKNSVPLYNAKIRDYLEPKLIT
jgi:hypothetical protein